MSNDHTELSADQIKLVEAFQAAAAYFATRIMNVANIDTDMEASTIEKLVSAFGSEQANSKIADEAGRRFSAAVGASPETIEQDVSQALKRGGNHPDGGYFATEAAETIGVRKRSKLSTDCYNNVMRNLLLTEKAQTILPRNYIVNQINVHGGNLPKPNH